jgi:hypothetical protein
MKTNTSFTAFAANRLIASGDIQTTLLQVKEHLDQDARSVVLIFDDSNGKQIDFDFRGTAEQVLARLPAHPHFKGKDEVRSGPGRPKLGIVCREVSLLPRHWEWLEQQPQGASAALRKLVEDAKRSEPDKERARQARDAAGKFMWAIGGHLEDFEEASRALYAMDLPKFEKLTVKWPKDIRAHLLQLLQPVALWAQSPKPVRAKGKE